MHIAFDQVLGCLIGGAIGDALGGVSERGRLSISDDTQLTLATCEAISFSKPVSPELIAASFLRWYRAGALTGLGSATLKALRDLSVGAHWALSGAVGEMSAGNGAAMRAAPLAFALDPRDPADRVTIRDVCRITHHSDEAYIGALVVLLAIRASTLSANHLFTEIAASLPDSRVRDRVIKFAALPSDIPLTVVAEEFGASGYVVETVPLAVLAATRMSEGTFESTLADLDRTGGDADTIGAIAGQIAGYRIGFANLPKHLVALPPITEVVSAATAFARDFGG